VDKIGALMKRSDENWCTYWMFLSADFADNTDFLLGYMRIYRELLNADFKSHAKSRRRKGFVIGGVICRRCLERELKTHLYSIISY